MTDTLHKFTNFFTDKGREINKVEHQATELIHKKLKDIISLMAHTPKDRLPDDNIHLDIEHLQHSVEELMIRIDKHAEELPEYEKVQEVMDVCKQTTLKKYVELIPQSNKVTPFATFGELFRNSHADLSEDQEKHTLLFSLAVDALFNHPNFEETLVEKILMKENMLVHHCPDENSIERQNVVTFLAHYEQCKVVNPALEKNQILENEIRELRSILFFQDQTHILEKNLKGIAPNLAGHLEQWSQYLNSLSAEEHAKKMALHQATEICTNAYEVYVSAQLWR